MINKIKDSLSKAKDRKKGLREIHTQIGNSLKEKDLKICCLIPAYNESSRINRVLADISNYEFFNTILVVNDGSFDNTAEVVREFKQLKELDKLELLDLEENLGKSGAVLRGVEEVKEEIIVFLDADLVGLNHQNLDKLIYPLVCKDYRMAILDRPTDRRAVSAILGISRLFGGERSVWKEDILDMDLNEDDGYTLETKMNMYYLNKGEKVRTVYAPNLETILHTKKDGVIKGTVLYLKMFWNMYKAANIHSFYIQASDVEYEQLEELYEFYNSRKHKGLYRPWLFIFFTLFSISLFT